MEWRNRIVGEGLEDPEQLAANPRNFRIHPQQQAAALDAILDKVGWVQQVIVNRTTGYVVDGHLRVMMAMRRGEPEIPVVYVELSEDEEAMALALLDPISAMANGDAVMLARLLDDVDKTDTDIAKLLKDLTKGKLTDILADAPSETLEESWGVAIEVDSAETQERLIAEYTARGYGCRPLQK